MITLFWFVFLINIPVTISFHRDGHAVFPKSKSPENSSPWQMKANGKICVLTHSKGNASTYKNKGTDMGHKNAILVKLIVTSCNRSLLDLSSKSSMEEIQR